LINIEATRFHDLFQIDSAEYKTLPPLTLGRNFLMLLPSFLFFIVKNFRVSFDEKLIFGIVELSPTDPV